MAAYVYAVEGLGDLGPFDDLPAHIVLAARQAVNKTADRARTAGARLMQQQVAFGAAYINERLQVTKRAQGTSLEAKVTGRFRATSLARFESSNAAPGQKGGLRVEVKPGVAKFMPNAFLMKLRSGGELTDTKFNLGLAIRLRPGETLHNKRQLKHVGRNLYLLYGPSIDQVFRSVAHEIVPDMTEFLAAEFQRLVELRK
jgi:hypothetical protein